MALIENIQRENLNPIDEALAYRRLSEEFQLDAGRHRDQRSARIARRSPTSCGCSSCPAEVRAEVAAGTLSMGHARALLALTERGRSAAPRARRDRPQPVGARNRIAGEEGRRRGSRAADAPAPGGQAGGRPHPRRRRPTAPRCSARACASSGRARSGRIEIDFGSEDELIRIYDQLTAGALGVDAGEPDKSRPDFSQPLRARRSDGIESEPLVKVGASATLKHPVTNRTAAIRYARALFDVAVKEQVDLQILDDRARRVRRALPAASGARKGAAEPGGARAAQARRRWPSSSRARDVSPVLAKLLVLLAERDRLVLLPDLLGGLSRSRCSNTSTSSAPKSRRRCRSTPERVSAIEQSLVARDRPDASGSSTRVDPRSSADWWPASAARSTTAASRSSWREWPALSESSKRTSRCRVPRHTTGEQAGNHERG